MYYLFFIIKGFRLLSKNAPRHCAYAAGFLLVDEMIIFC